MKRLGFAVIAVSTMLALAPGVEALGAMGGGMGGMGGGMGGFHGGGSHGGSFHGGGWHGGGWHGGGWHGGGWHGGHFHGGTGFFFGFSPFVAPYYYPYPYYSYPYPYYSYPYPYYSYSYPPPPYAYPSEGPEAGAPPGEEAQAPPQDDAAEEARQANYGLVQLRGVADGADVDLDGRFWLRAEELDNRWLALPRGAHTLVVRVEGAAPVERRIQVESGKTQVVRFTASARRHS